MRLIRKLPKVGFNAYESDPYQIVNLGVISERIKKDKLEVTPTVLKEAGLIKSRRKPVKILADGEIKRSLNFSEVKLSASAVKKIEAAGGKVIMTNVRSQMSNKSS